VKTNLFSRFRNLFRRAEPDYEYDESYEDYDDVGIDEPIAGEEPFDEQASIDAQSGRALQMPHGVGAPCPDPQGQGVHVPLAPIVADLPLELQSRVLHEVGDLSIFLSVDDILPQLSKGSVSISFGELREAAPKVFSGDRDQDTAEISVPLSAILPHINPEMLARKHGPLQVDIPDDIVSPFEGKGKGLAIGSVKPKAAAPAPQPTPARAPSMAATLPAHALLKPSAHSDLGLPRPMPSRPSPVAQSVTPQRAAVPLSMPRPGGNGASQPATPAKPAPSITAAAPVQSSRPSTPLPSMTNKGTAILGRTDAPKPVAPAVSLPEVTNNGTIILDKADVRPTPVKKVPVAPVQQAALTPAPTVPIQQAASKAAQRPLVVSLSAVAAAWPDSLKQEIIQLGITEAKLALPYDAVEGGLKRGRLSFCWQKLRFWVTPQPAVAASLHDGTELELPLRIVAPLFVAQKKEKPDVPKVAVDKDIPNLFFGLPQPDTAGVAVDHSVNRPVDTNYYVWDEGSETVADDAVTHSPTAGTEFVSRYATPNEVVSRAEGLDGVEGAVIALPDGLMVASKLSAGLNGDTLAAFLPQLFGKVTQCTQELRMGELNNLNFTVGNVPWKIFRVNALYFAAFGSKDLPLPTAKLAALASELDHKAKV